MSSDEGFSREEIEQIASMREVRDVVMSREDTPYGYPEPPDRDSLLKLFRDIIALLDDDYSKISRVGNVTNGELGFLAAPSRVYLDLANFCEYEGWDTVSNYLRRKSNIVFSTSLSRKAALLSLAVTQKRVSQNIGQKIVRKKSGLFGSKEEVVGGEE